MLRMKAPNVTMNELEDQMLVLMRTKYNTDVSSLQFTTWLHERNFSQLYNVWVSTGYAKEYKPTLALSGEPYSDETVMFKVMLTIADSGVKNVFKRLPHGKYPIAIYTDEESAILLNTGVDPMIIRKCIHCKKNVGGGYRWTLRIDDCDRTWFNKLNKITKYVFTAEAVAIVIFSFIILVITANG